MVTMRFWAFLLIFTAINTDVKVFAAKGQPRSALQFHAFQGCKGVPTHLDVLNSSVSRSKQGVSFMSAEFYNHKVVNKFSKMELTITKCLDAVSYNTCEYEGTHKFSVGLCQLITAKNMPWSSFLTNLQPPVRCPFQTGAYSLKNASVDMNSVLRFAGSNVLEKYYGNVYMTEVRCFNEKNELHVCFAVTYSFIRLRN